MFYFEWWDMLVGGREGNKHFKSSNSGLNSFSISQSLSLSPSVCTFYPSLLNHQNKAHFVHSQCPGSTLAPLGSCFRSCFLPTGPAWPWLSALLFETPWGVFTGLNSQDMLSSACSGEVMLPQLCSQGPKPRQQLTHSWREQLVWTFGLGLLSINNPLPLPLLTWYLVLNLWACFSSHRLLALVPCLTPRSHLTLQGSGFFS